MTQARERVSEQQSVVSVQATALVLNRWRLKWCWYAWKS